ncbi:MAG: hypothetical protein GWP05_01665 [Anaerolineaceae bacterium]|nr:hypothetical protein [Anaerolineaceae bacterium]
MTRRTLERTKIGGFTLIELLIVIVIIILLGTIAMTAMGPILERVDRVKCGAQLSSVFTSYMAYVNRYSKIYPPLYSPREYDYKTKRYNLDPRDNYYIANPVGYWRAGFGPLTWHGLIKAEYYVCPSVVDSDDERWRTKADSNIEYWWGRYPNPHPDRLRREQKISGNPPQAVIKSNEKSFASYSIRHKLYPWTPSQVASPQPDLGKETDENYYGQGRRAILADNLNSLEMIEERHEVGLNVAYMDGSVEFRQGGTRANWKPGIQDSRGGPAFLCRLLSWRRIVCPATAGILVGSSLWRPSST